MKERRSDLRKTIVNQAMQITALTEETDNWKRLYNQNNEDWNRLFKECKADLTKKDSEIQSLNAMIAELEKQILILEEQANA